MYDEKYYVIGNTFYTGSWIGIDPETGKQGIGIIDLTEIISILPTGLYYNKNKLTNQLIMTSGTTIGTNKEAVLYFLTRYDNVFDALLILNHEKPRKIIGNIP